MKRLAVALVLITATAHADDGFLHRLVAEARARLDAVRLPAKPVPPAPVPLRKTWKKLGAIDLGAPLVALVGAKLDGKPAIYAVTPREVAAIAVDKHPRVIASAKVTAEPAVIEPRDLVGSAVVDGGALVASASSWAHGVRVQWRAGALVADASEPGFELCAGERVQLVPGRNYFVGSIYNARCRGDLVDAAGNPLRVRAELGIGNRLEITLDSGKHVMSDVGAVFELADIDRDGTPEVIFSGAGAPGDPDAVKIVSVGDDPARHAKAKKEFKAGGVAGIAVVDLDGDGVEYVIVAERLDGATKFDLWRLE